MEEEETVEDRLAEELGELRQSLARCADDPALLVLDSIVRSIPDLIYRLDGDCRILFINDAIERYGYTARELIGTNILDLFHPEDREKAVYKVNERRRGMRCTKSLELRLLTRNNASVPFEFRSSSTEVDPTLVISAEGVYAADTSKDGQFICTQGVGRDITERKWIEEALRKARDDLEKEVEERTADLAAANVQLEGEIIERRQVEDILQKAIKREESMGQMRDRIIAMRDISDLPAEQYWIEKLRQMNLEIAGFSLQFPASRPDYFVSYLLDTHRYTEELPMEAFPWVQQVWDTGEPVLARREDLDIAGWEEEYKCILEVPLPGGGSLGVSSVVDVFDEDAIRTVQVCAGLVAEGLQRVRDFEVLRESEEQHRRFLDELPVGVSHNTPEGDVLYCNPQARKMLGYTSEEYTRIMAPDIYVNPEDRRDLIQNLEEKGEHSYEYQLRHKDGRSIWVGGTTRLMRDREGKVVRYQGFVEDITEQREREQSNRINLAIQRVRNAVLEMESEEDWQALAARFFEELDALVDFDGCGINIVDVETSTLVSFSMSGQGAVEIGRVELKPALEEALETGKHVYRRNRREIEQYRDNLGEERKCVVDIPFLNGTIALNSAREYAFDERDIAVLEQFAQVLSEAFRRLEDLKKLATKEEQLLQAQKMEAVGQLTAGVAHNFNNMLQGITGNLDLALEESSEKIRPFLEGAYISARKSADMIKQLMAYSRQGIQPQTEAIACNQLIREVVQICHKTFDRKIRIDTHLPDEMLVVIGNFNQLEQVLLNFCVNARDAFDEVAGRQPIIEVSAEAVAMAVEDLRESNVDPGCFVRIAVSDNGQGMDEETQRRVFEPFFTTKDVDKGTGLGLSTVFGIVQQRGGWVEVSSQLDRGSTFAIYLPASDEMPVVQSSGDVVGSVRGTETVLIIDDEDVVRRSTVRLLEKWGYEVLSAVDGEDGLKIAHCRADEIDLVLLDLSMPGISGEEVLDRLSAVGMHAKVILFTGFAVHKDEFRGVDEVVQKPFTLEELSQKMRAVLAQ